MRICHIITRLIVGGAQENTLLTCEGLCQRGHDVTLLAGPETGPEGSLWDRARAGGYRLEAVEPLVRTVSPWRDWRCRRELRRRLTALRPDVVHTHSSKAGVLGRLAARDAHVGLIVHTIHGMSFNRTQRRPVRWLFRRLERHCGRFTDGFICVADAMTAQAVAAGIAPAGKFTTIYSGLEIERFDPTRCDRRAVRDGWGFGEDAIVVGTVARLFAGKGYEYLIPAMKAAVRQEPRLRFVWVGDGPHRRQYVGELSAGGLLDRVVVTGLVRPALVPQLLGGMDLVVHASAWEGLPRAAVEALLMEIPVISFDNDGAPEVVASGQTGELVPFGDIEGLAQAIVRLARDEGARQRHGRQGRRACLGRFCHRRMVDQIERYYTKLSVGATDRGGFVRAEAGQQG